MKTCEENGKIIVTFNKNNPNWEDERSYNLMFIRGNIQLVNDELAAMSNGSFISLSYVFGRLGLPFMSEADMYKYIAGNSYVEMDILNELEYLNKEVDELQLSFNTEDCWHDDPEDYY